MAKCLSQMVKKSIPLRPKTCILGINPRDFVRTKQMKLTDFGLLHARRMIVFCWKNVESPVLQIYIVKGKQDEFVYIWNSFMSFGNRNSKMVNIK